MGDIEGKPFNATKLAAFMDMPRTTVLRRLTHLEKWGLIYRTGRNYFAYDKAFNSITGLNAYRRRRKLLDTFVEELSILDKRL